MFRNHQWADPNGKSHRGRVPNKYANDDRPSVRPTRKPKVFCEAKSFPRYSTGCTAGLQPTHHKKQKKLGNHWHLKKLNSEVHCIPLLGCNKLAIYKNPGMSWCFSQWVAIIPSWPQPSGRALRFAPASWSTFERSYPSYTWQRSVLPAA